MATDAAQIAQYTEELGSEYVLELREAIASSEVIVSNLRVAGGDGSPGLDELRAETERLMQYEASTNYPSFDLGIGRLSHYINGLDNASARQLDDIEIFLDVLRGLVEGEIDHDLDEAEFVRSLPARIVVDVSEIAHPHIEFLIVEPQRTTARLIERELQNCGYRAALAGSSLEAIELAMRTRPNLVISAAVLDHLSGTDLACALAAMPRTRSIPFVLLTSFDRDHESLVDLPEQAVIVNKGKDFSNDLAAALENFGII